MVATVTDFTCDTGLPSHSGTPLPPRALRCLGRKQGATMSRTGILPALLVIALSLCLGTSAEARKWRWWHIYGHGYSAYGHGYSARSGYDRRARTTARAETARSKTGGPFGAVINRLVHGCLEQASEFQSWPFDAITRIVAPDDVQLSALEALRNSAAAAAERLSSECPRDASAPPWARLEAAQQAIDAATAVFAELQPSLQAFYAALDDEQKARLLRDMTLGGAQVRSGDRAAERWEHRSRRRGDADAERAGRANLWAGICEHLTVALRSWPIHEIERGVRLSEAQRVAFYELITSSLRAAERSPAPAPPQPHSLRSAA